MFPLHQSPMASQQGLEPRIIEPESIVLPITLLGNMASPQGFEPRPRAPKTLVLPLHHGEIYGALWKTRTPDTRGRNPLLCSTELIGHY